jgi:hypothetical protein
MPILPKMRDIQLSAKGHDVVFFGGFTISEHFTQRVCRKDSLRVVFPATCQEI